MNGLNAASEPGGRVREVGLTTVAFSLSQLLTEAAGTYPSPSTLNIISSSLSSSIIFLLNWQGGQQKRSIFKATIQYEQLLILRKSIFYYSALRQNTARELKIGLSSLRTRDESFSCKGRSTSDDAFRCHHAKSIVEAFTDIEPPGNCG
jgi:hypothetical protein